MKKESSNNMHQWTPEEEDAYPRLSKSEMDALRSANPQKFSSINGWWVVISQVIFTLLIAGLFYIFIGLPDRNVYTYSALVGGFIGFAPSALFLLRLEATKKTINTGPGSFLTAVVSGEFLKILLTLLLFIGFALKQPDLKWIPLLVAYFVTIKSYLLVWLWGSKR